MRTDILKVDVISSSSLSVDSITKALKKIRVKAEVNIDDETIIVEYNDSKVSLFQIIDVIQKLGYKVA